MKQRNPFAVAILGFITFGIYGLYWLGSTRKALVRETGRAVPSIWLLVVPSLIAGVLYFAAFIPMILSIPTSAGSQQQPPAGFFIVFAGFGLAALILAAVHVYWFLKYAKAVDAYTNKEMSTAVTFILLYLLNVIGMAVIQESFNGIESHASTEN